jgi:broad specificity phosphatase PhoE
MHLYLIRHADPGYTDDSLTEQGHREAEALARRLATHGLDYLYASRTVRSLKTAEYVARLLNIPVVEETWIIEPSHLRVRQKGRAYVIWDTFGEVVRGATSLPTRQSWFEHPPFHSPEVRSMWEEFQRRSDELMARHGYRREGGRYRIERKNRERIAIVSHNGTVLLFLAHLLELPVPLVWCGFYAWPASVTTIYFEEHSRRWAVPRALGVADVSHLHVAGLEPQPRGMGAGRYDPYL